MIEGISSPHIMGLNVKELLDVFDRIIEFGEHRDQNSHEACEDVDILLCSVCKRLIEMVNDNRIFVKSIETDGSL